MELYGAQHGVHGVHGVHKSLTTFILVHKELLQEVVYFCSRFRGYHNYRWAPGSLDFQIVVSIPFMF